MRRLQSLHLPIKIKALRIQSSVWPYGLHGADLHFVCPRHIAKLRRAATNALVGEKIIASPWLAMMVFSRFLIDPLLYVVTSAFRLLRRMVTYYPEMIKTLAKKIVNFQGKVTYGPASSIKRYLMLLGWDINKKDM